MDLSIKNILLAGLGTIAHTYEKAEEVIDEMVKKGEITVGEGKELNEELKVKIKENLKTNEGLSSDELKDILSQLNLATKKDIDEIKVRLDKLEKDREA